MLKFLNCFVCFPLFFLLLTRNDSLDGFILSYNAFPLIVGIAGVLFPSSLEVVEGEFHVAVIVYFDVDPLWKFIAEALDVPGKLHQT